MNYKQVGYIISLLLLMEAAFMIPPLAISFYLAEHAAIRGYIASIVIIMITAGILYRVCRDRKGGFYADRYACVRRIPYHTGFPAHA